MHTSASSDSLARGDPRDSCPKRWEAALSKDEALRLVPRKMLGWAWFLKNRRREGQLVDLCLISNWGGYLQPRGSAGKEKPGKRGGCE